MEDTLAFNKEKTSSVLTVDVPDHPPMLICLPTLSGKVIPAEQNTSVFSPFIVRQAPVKLPACEGSSS